MMRETIAPYRRMLLQGQEADDVMKQSSTPVLLPDSIFQPINVSASEILTSPRRNSFNYKNPSSSSPPSVVDSSMALTILVLLTAVFFMGFLSIYIRRLAREESAGIRRGGSGEQNNPSSGVGQLCVNRKGKGLEPSTIQLLPLVSYREDAKQLIMITGCSICLTEFEVKEIVRLIPHCKHLFHPQCLDTWLSSHRTCPLCRSTQLFQNDVDGEDEICLDVKEVQGSSSSSELMGQRSTDERNDTSMERAPSRFIKSCSYTNLGARVVLQRSVSF